MKILTNILLRFAALATVALCATSCDTAKASTSDDSLQYSYITPTLKESVISATDNRTTAIFFYTPQAATWSAEIVEGAEFASFKLKEQVATANGEVNTQSSPNVLYVYLLKNELRDERTAKIEFTLDGKCVDLLLKQTKAGIAKDDPYALELHNGWAEMPEFVDDKGYFYTHHKAKLDDGQTVRNYSVCFDPESRASLWVAYPLHSIYRGDYERNDKWLPDPNITSSLQPDLLRYSYKGSYDRGHQIPSADRDGNKALNDQTFYCTNVTPQASSLNRGKWQTLESTVRSQMCSDTLYVVTGADYSSSIGTTTDAAGNEVPLPRGYYKVLLRTRKGNTGKSIFECEPEELKSVGFWYSHADYSSVAIPQSVESIEEMVGFEFFPAVADEVKATYDPTIWNLQ